MLMRVVVVALLLCAVTAVASNAQVTVEREGDENPVMTIAKSVLWGGLAGVVLGGAVALVAEQNEEDIVKWFFVGGTFAGLGYGIYHVSTREKPSSALLRIDGDGLDWGFPSVALERGLDRGRRGIRGTVTLVDVSF
jgi:hypothetical protein